jgi:hypothetical protein
MATPNLKSVILVFTFFLLLAASWFVVGIIGFTKAVTSGNWPTVQGTVVSSQVVRPTGKSTKYIAEVTFTYTVDNKEYTSKKLKATSARGTSSWAKEVVANYPAGKEVLVHYRPGKPQVALIEPGLQKDNFMMTIIPILVFALIFWAFLNQLKQKALKV